MRIGLFGGSFDPVHHGHLLLAREALEKLALDEIRFLPAAQSPFKQGGTTASARARLEMLHAAIADEPGFMVDDRELHRPPPSYAIHTVESIAGENPGAALFFLIGADHVAALDQWHRADALRKAVRFVVFTRPGQPLPGNDLLVLEKYLDVSATDIRNRVAAGKSIRFLVPDCVISLIQSQGLYHY